MTLPFEYEALPNGPDWWLSGASIRNRYDHQRATALIDYRGRAVARLDRGVAGFVDLQVVAADWEPDPVTRLELTETQVARITYEADRAMRMAAGEPGVKEWISLTDTFRAAWLAQLDDGETMPISGRREDKALNRLRTKMLLALRDCLRASSA